MVRKILLRKLIVHLFFIQSHVRILRYQTWPIAWHEMNIILLQNVEGCSHILHQGFRVNDKSQMASSGYSRCSVFTHF